MAKTKLSRLIFQKRPLIVASLGKSKDLIREIKMASSMGADLIEIRVDHFPKRLFFSKELLKYFSELKKNSSLPFILTIRSQKEGGALPKIISEKERLRLYKLLISKAEVVDIELKARQINHLLINEAHKKKKKVILSFHDFQKIPTNRVIRHWIQKGIQLKGDILKFAGFPQSQRDISRFMALCYGFSKINRVFIAMGQKGRKTREEGFRWGSFLSYGYVKHPMAPGQVSVSKLATIHKRFFKKISHQSISK